MSGPNYNLSVAQVMESEKKLKVISLLSLGLLDNKALPVTDLTFSSVNDVDQPSTSPLAIFESILDNDLDYELPDDDVNVLLYISGYVIHSVQKTLQCSLCLAQ